MDRGDEIDDDNADDDDDENPGLSDFAAIPRISLWHRNIIPPQHDSRGLGTNQQRAHMLR